MNVNDARKILAEAQSCFQDLNLTLVNESENLDCSCCANYLHFRSWISKNDKLGEIQIFIFVENDIIQLSTCFYEDYDESITRKLLEFINGVNYHLSDNYWILYSANSKFEYRTVQAIVGNAFNKDIFKEKLKEFLENWLYDYDFIRRTMQSNEDLDTLLNEWLNPISIDEM